MSEPIIRVENLGKQYFVKQREDGPRYRALREVLTDGVKTGFGLFGGKRTTRHEEFWALKDVNFEVNEGEVVGIIGRNGAGKSTLLKILSRITEPTTGRVTLNGRIASLLEVGTGFHPELTGRENIYLNGSILGMSRTEISRKFDEIVAFAEVEKFLDTPVKRYSSGMYVRLAFAVAAHLEPEILIIDEVLAVGDAGFQKKCLGKMDEVAKGGRTVLFVSHNMDAIATLCSKGLLLREGRVAAIGPIDWAIGMYFHEVIEPTDGNYDLTGHPRRSRDHLAWIRGIILRARGGMPAAAFLSLEPMTIELSVQAHDLVQLPRYAVAIEDHVGRRIFTLASYFSTASPGRLEGVQVVRCEIPALRLGSGRYQISVSLASHEHGMLDSVDGAAWFDVESHNCYQSGESYLPVYGPILEESSWTRI